MEQLFSNLTIAGIPLLAVTLGLVQFIKSFGLNGTVVRIVSLLVGVLLGIGYQFSVAAPVSFADWFTVIVFGISLGLVASGIYDAAKS